jgi:hypothetical protein
MSRRQIAYGVIALVAVTGWVCRSSEEAGAVDTNWQVSSGDWQTSGNWTAGVPTNGDNAWIANGGTVNITLTGPQCLKLYMGQTGDNSIVMNSGDLSIGNGSTRTAAFIGYGTTTSTGTFTLNGGTLTLLYNAQLEVGSWKGPGYFYQNGGTVTHVNNVGVGAFYVGAYATGTYVLAGGTVNSPQTSVGYGGYWSPSTQSDGIGLFVQTGGSHTTPALIVGEGWDEGGTGTYDMQNGILTVDEVYLGILDSVRGTGAVRPLVGTFNQSGGTVTINSLLQIGSDATFTSGQTGGAGQGTYNFTGGTLTDGANNANLIVRADAPASGTFRGRGAVDLSGTLTNNGRVIADGGTLDMSTFAAVLSTVENTAANGSTNNGWFAVDGGKLVLPSIGITGSGSVNWGEDPSDTQPDLVNSVRLTLAGGSGSGSLDVSLLDSANAEVPDASGFGSILGIWEMSESGVTIGTVDLAFRYDDSLAVHENDVRLFDYVGGSWAQVPFTLDTVNDLISVAGLTSLPSFFLVAEVPEPASLALAATGLLALGLYGRRRFRCRSGGRWSP